MPAASCSLPEADNGTSRPSLLLGLAPGGVCPAVPVARNAVRSCRAVSPSLRRPGAAGHCASLWHYPSACAAWPLASAVALWRADFPHQFNARGVNLARSPGQPGHQRALYHSAQLGEVVRVLRQGRQPTEFDPHDPNVPVSGYTKLMSLYRHKLIRLREGIP